MGRLKNIRFKFVSVLAAVFVLAAPAANSMTERENEELRRIIAALSSQIESIPSVEKPVSVNFVDADLRGVISMLAERHGISIYGGERITGRITARVRDVPLETLFDMLLEANGYGMAKRAEGLYEIVTSDVAESRRIRKLVESLEFKSFYVKYADLDSAVNFIQSMDILDEHSKVLLYPETSTIMVRGTCSQLLRFEEALGQIDIQPPQILIRARVVEINKDMMDSLGIEWTADFLAGDFEFTGVEGRTAAPSLPQTSTFKFGMTHPRFNIDAAIEALVYRQIAKVLTAPRLTTINNVTATLHVTDQVPVITREQTVSQEGEIIVTTEDVAFEEVGLILNIHPRKVGGDRVHLRINPSITQVTSFTDTDPPQPVIDTRETVTEVILRHDQWLVIGGMAKTSLNEMRRKIPLLGDIPIIGVAFSSRGVREERSELLILVNAQLLDDELIGVDTQDALGRQRALEEGAPAGAYR